MLSPLQKKFHLKLQVTKGLKMEVLPIYNLVFSHVSLPTDAMI